jgi:hypothetical protein
VPNARLSIFIPASEDILTDIGLRNMYPFASINDKNLKGQRYNLLPDENLSKCYQRVGTFPSKRTILDNDHVLEIYEDYYKYTTTTNSSGDYFFFGVPLNSQTLHCDIDLSDAGILSQRPRDMMYKGYNITQFESPEQFKKDTNLNSLTQLIYQQQSVFVYPFWGDESESEIAITRCDIDIQYKFESTCVFMGSLFTTQEGDTVLKNCLSKESMGLMANLIPKNGTIEMIRKTFDGMTEFFQIQANQLIDGDGVFCYQIPCNLDYVITDEFGNLIPTDNPEMGIATKTICRFRMKLEEGYDSSAVRSEILVPHNPETLDEVDYNFSENTLDSSYTVMFWNKVYSVKSYIPRLQLTTRNKARKFLGIKKNSYYGQNNPIPYNNLHIRLPIMFTLVCAIAMVVASLVSTVNTLTNTITCLCKKCHWIVKIVVRFIVLPIILAIRAVSPKCIVLGEGWCALAAWVAAPGCTCGEMVDRTKKDPELAGLPLEPSYEKVINCVISSLANENETFSFDFANDWLNGSIFVPTFQVYKRQKVKRKWLGLFGPKITTTYLNFCGMLNESTNAAKSSAWFKRGVDKSLIYDGCSLQYDGNIDNPTFSYNSNGVCRSGRCFTQNTFHRIGEGFVNSFTELVNGVETTHYYHRPFSGMSTVVNSKNSYPKLFATDIILLGSLSTCDIDGIPRLFDYLPLTSYNYPPIMAEVGTEEEVPNPDDPSEMIISSENTEITGVNWGTAEGLPMEDQSGHGYYYDVQRLKGGKLDGTASGLFLGMNCRKVWTWPKSCINAKRLCELGVDLDMSIQKYNACGANNEVIPPDGLIMPDNMIDSEVRQMFATLNFHKIRPQNTLIVKGREFHKLEYLYPEAFDGKMKAMLKGASIQVDKFINTKNDIVDRDYNRFRLGDTPKFLHNGLQLPIYANSFYFYFGVKPGATAIEKFRNKYTAECLQYKEGGLSASVRVLSHASVCPCASNDPVEFEATIREFSESYSLTITDKFNNVVKLKKGSADANTTNLTDINLIFGEKDKNGTNYWSDEFKKPGTYNLIITDSTGAQFTSQFSIQLRNGVRFNAVVTQEILTELSLSECKTSCENTDDCICCSDFFTYIDLANDTTPNSEKGIITVRDIAGIKEKGCLPEDYEIEVTRSTTVGLGLSLNLKLNNANNQIDSITIGEGGMEFTDDALNKNILITGGSRNGIFQITAITNGSVTAIRLIDRGEFPNWENDPQTGVMEYSLSRVKFPIGAPSKLTLKDNIIKNDIPLYVCAGTYDITLRRINTDCEDSDTITIDMIQQPPLELVLGDTVRVKYLKTTGNSLQNTHCNWYNFYKYLIDNSKTSLTELRKWYSDPAVTAETVLQTKELLKNTFIAQCVDTQVINLAGLGYTTPYAFVLYGSRIENSIPVANSSDYQLVTEDEDGNPLPYDIPYITSESYLSGEVRSIDSLNPDADRLITPDGVALTISRNPITNGQNCEFSSGYKVGGYFAGVMGENGLGKGFSTGLNSVMKQIKKNDPDIEKISVVEIWDYFLHHDGFNSNAWNRLFFFHIFDKQLKVRDEYTRMAAAHLGYIAPGLSSSIDIPPYFDIWYNNGPNTDLILITESESEGGEEPSSEFTVGGMMVGIDNSYSLLGGDENSLPTTRHFWSIGTEISGDSSISITHSKPIISEDGEVTYQSFCDVNIDLSSTLKLEYRGVKLKTTLNETNCTVTNTLCYSLLVSTDGLPGNPSDIIKNLVQTGDLNVGSYTYYQVDQGDNRLNFFGTGATVNITVAMRKIVKAQLNKRGEGYAAEDKLYVEGVFMPVKVKDVTADGGIASVYPVPYGVAPGFSNGIYENIRLLYTSGPPENSTRDPMELLYYPWNSLHRVDYPYFTSSPTAPYPGSAKAFDDTDVASWITKNGDTIFPYFVPTPACRSKVINNTSDLFYHIVHDHTSGVRAFSQPLEINNYVKINSKTWDTETETISLQVQVVGSNTFVNAGYTYKIVEGNYTYANGEVTDFIPTGIEYSYPSVRQSTFDFTLLKVDPRFKDLILKVSVTDATGLEFFIYTSAHDWINPDLTECEYECSPTLTKGFVIDLSVTNYNDIDYPLIAFASTTSNTGTTQILRHGRNWIKVGSTLSNGITVTEGTINTLYIKYGTVTKTINDVVVSSCNMKYSVSF